MTIELTATGGKLRAIYDDALSDLIAAAESVTTRRASHVEPDGRDWSADMGPVGGPVLRGFTTRAAALGAERDYLNRHLHTLITG